MNLQKITKEDKKKFEKNITLNYITSCLMWGRFFIPVLALFYIASQVPLEQFAIIMSVFSLSILLLEIPTGVISDLIGRKKTLLLSRLMYIIEVYILAFHNGFLMFLIAKIISGIGVSLASGTDSALLFDSLKRLGRQKEHKKIFGISQTIMSVSMAFVFIIGAFLFSINAKLPAILTLPFMVAGFIFTFFFEEPYQNHKKINFKNYVKHFKQAVVYFFKKAELRYLAFYSLVIGSAISAMQSFSSVYYENIAIPISLIGVCAFAASIITAWSSKKTHSIEERIGERKSLYFVQIVTLIAVILMSLMMRYIGILFYFLIAFICGFYAITLNDYANKHVRTSHRATMLSINNMFDNIGVILFFPVMGYLIKEKSMSFSFFSFAVFIAVYLLILFLSSRGIWKNAGKRKI